jgi:hypothetical protein
VKNSDPLGSALSKSARQCPDRLISDWFRALLRGDAASPELAHDAATTITSEITSISYASRLKSRAG